MASQNTVSARVGAKYKGWSMVRKFVIALSSLAGSLFLSEAYAIGLGEITLRSSLNEPLRAEIQLNQLNDTLINSDKGNFNGSCLFFKGVFM